MLLAKKGRPFSHAQWSPEGKSLYLITDTGFTRWERATGHEQELYRGPRAKSFFNLSPNGRWLAFYSAPDLLALVPTTGGDARTVLRLEEKFSDTSVPFVAWTPDSEHLLFPKQGNQLWKVHIATGQLQQIGPPIKNLIDVAVHPDGRQIAFSIQEPGNELWIMEGFLP